LRYLNNMKTVALASRYNELFSFRNIRNVK